MTAISASREKKCLNTMEQLNKVELIGTVGSVYVKDFGKTRCVNFSVATNYCFKDRDGCPVVETTWHRIVTWQGEGCPNLDIIQKGTPLHVLGRIRRQRYVGADGEETVLLINIFVNLLPRCRIGSS